LNSPVVPAVARRGHGLDDIVTAACEVASGRGNTFRLDYGFEIEEAISLLEATVSDHSPARDGCSLRWLAIRLLEGDADIAARLFSNFDGESARSLAETCRARLTALLGND